MGKFTEALKKREEEKEKASQSGGKFTESLAKRKAEQAYEQIASGYNTILEDYKALADSHSSRFGNGYQSDAADWHSQVSNRANEVGTEIEGIKALLDQYESYYDADWVSNAREGLDYFLAGYGDLASMADTAQKYWAQWADEDAYNKDAADWLEEGAQINRDYIAARQKIYDSNAERIAELENGYVRTGVGIVDDTINGIIDTWNTHVKGKAPRDEADKKEAERLRAENLRYMREQAQLDKYFKPITQEFLQNAKYRDYNNPTAQDIEAYAMSVGDTAALIASGAELTSKGWVDKDGNVILQNRAINNPPPIVEDKLAFYLDNKDSPKSVGSDYARTFMGEIMMAGKNGSWEFLKEDEKDIYYDLLKSEGQQSAYEFLDAMKPTLNKRATMAMAKDIAYASALEQVFYNVASILAQMTGGATAFVDDAINMLQGKDINPYSQAHSLQNFAQAVRQDTEADINKATGNAALPYVGTTFGDVYQFLMSGADSLAGVGLGGAGYGILMGMGAASAEAKELYEKGASIGQIATGSALAGAAEYVFEKFSIDKFINMGDTKTMKDLVINILKQGGVEASEETFTEIANVITDAAVMGSQSDWQGYVDKYVAQGLSESEAAVKALFNDVAPDVINAAIGGFVSGGGMGSLGSLSSYVDNKWQEYNGAKAHGQKIIDAGGVDTLKALALEMASEKGTPNSQNIDRLVHKVDSKASARNVGRLSAKIEETISAQNLSDIQNALVDKGLSKSEAKRVAEFIRGDKPLTAKQKEEIKDNEKINAVVKELIEDPKSTLNQREVNLLAARIGVDAKNAKINEKSTSVEGVTLKNDVDVKGKVSEKGKTTKISTGEEITIDKSNAIAKTAIVDGERVVYYNTDHGVVESTDVNYANEDDGLLFEAFSDMNPAFANAVIKNYDGSVPMQTYIDGMREGIILYGMHNFQEIGKDIPTNSDVAALPEADRYLALKLGRAYAKANAKKADTKLRTAIKNAAEKAKASEVASTTEANQNKPKKGDVRFENGARAKTSSQKRAVNLAKHLAKAIGIDIVFYDAMTTKDNHGKNANGYFDSKTNSIHLDLQNSMTDSKTIAFTLSHELVHFIKKWSPAKFNTFSKFLMEQYAAHGVSTSTLLANKMAALGTTNADRAYEEMIADACERMLLDSNAVVKLMELRKADLELFEKIKLHVLEILNNIRDAFKGVDPNTEEGIALQKMEDILGKIHEMFEDAVVDAAQNYQAGQTLDTEAVSVSEDGTIQMQMKQYQQTGRSTLLNYLTSQYGENNANDLISTIDSIYNVMAEIKEDTALSVFGNWQDTEVELNAEGHPIFTTSINNGDYVLNQDFSRVCKKRRQLDFVLNMLAEDPAFEASHLTNEDFVKINNAIKSHGFEIACALCFVDSKRFRQAEWADSFANTWNDILGSIVKDDSKLTPFNFATNNPNMSDDGIEIDSSKSVTYRKWSEGKEDVKNRRTYDNFEQMFAKGKNGKWLEGNTNVRTIATLLRDHPELRHTFRGADIIASKGFDTIQRLAPEVRSILDGWGGSSVPKPSSNDASYDSSIINSKGYNKENAYAMGGVRMNSFSDFMAHMFFDYCQAFADLSAKELPSQAYTKELTYVRLFGRSGQKINMSGIAAIREDALPTVAGKGVTKVQAEANEKIEKMVAGLDITRLLEHLNKDIYQLTDTDVEQFLDMCDYVWADESINMKHATLLQTGILYDKLSETKIEECYELLKAGRIEQALKAAGKENVDTEYAKHCGTIVVGVSDAHIRKLLRDPNVRMVIPYHKSGLNPIIARELKISAYNDYTDVQNTGVVRKGTKSRSNLTNEEIKKAYGLKDFAFYDWFGKTIDGKLYDGKATADKYLEWCEKGYYDESVGDYVYYTSKGDGYILASELRKKLTVEPKFKDFTGEENYYKLLEDFDCYNTITGEHSEQGAVNFLRDGLPADYKGVLIEALKAEQKVSDDFKEHLDNKGLRDEIIDIVKPRGYTPSETTEDDGIKSQKKTVSDHSQAALEEFGTTSDFDMTGFVLEDGKMLNLSMYGLKGVQHKRIEAVFDDVKGADAVNRFIQEGNVRIKATSPGIEIGTEKAVTSRQLGAISRFISSSLRSRGRFYLDITDSDGKYVASVIYSDSNTAEEVIYDIEDYYESGEIPDPTVYYQKKTVTNRTLLANALESAAQSDKERKKLEQYKSQIARIESEQAKLAEVKTKANELRRTKGKTPDEIKKMKALDVEAMQIANRINTYGRQLLNLESTSALKNVLQREKQKALERSAQKGKEALEKYKEKAAEKQKELKAHYQESRKKGVEGRRKTEMRGKIRKVVRDLNHLLNHGTKERNVKEGMQEAVASAITLAEVLFSDEISNADIVRLGVASVMPDEKKYLAEYKDALDSLRAIDDQLAGLESVENPNSELFNTHDDLEGARKKLKNKISGLNQKLSSVFVRERARLNEGKVADVIGKLVNEYSALENSGDDYIKNAYSESVKKRLEALQKDLGGTLVRDMDIYQLTEVYDAYKMIAHMVRTSNQLFRDGRAEVLSEYVMKTQEEILRYYKAKKDPISNIEEKKNLVSAFAWNNLKPVYAFDRLGSETFEKLYWDAVRADDDFAVLVTEAGNFLQEQRAKYGYADWNLSKATEFKLADGKTFKLTLEDMMSIYAYSKRDQAEKHMTEGGFVFDENNTYSESPFEGKKILENFRLKKKHAKLTETYLIDDRVLAKIIGFFNKDENADKKAYVDAMQKYMTDMGQKGNEVSRVLYGIDLFTEENYIPLQSSADYRNSNEQALQKTPTQVSLKNNGTTKPTTPGANNPIVLRAFDELWLEHIDTMSKYCAYVLPIENLTRVFNNVSRSEGKSPMAKKTLISATFGKEAEAYIDQYITDLNGGNSVGGYNSPLMTMFSRFKATRVAASLSVWVQQPFAIIRAMDMIRPDYFVPFLRFQKKSSDADSTWEEIKKYAPIAILKEMGGYDIGSAGTTKDYIGITDYKGFKGKVKGFVKDSDYRKKTFDDLVMIGAIKMDELGWGIIWKAVKKEVATEQKLKPGTEEFFKAVRDRFTEVVVRTQVYDSVNSRSGLMRSKSDLNKFATSFAGEPTTTINMLDNAVLKVTRAFKYGNAKEKAKAIAKLTRTAGVVTASIVFTSLAKSSVYANRDDEDDESWTERWMRNFGESLTNDLNPLTMIPYIRDLVSVYEGWDVERPDMTLAADVITSAKRAIVDGATEEEIFDLIGDFSDMLGIPAKNVIRDVKGIYNLISDHFDNITTTDAWGAFERGWDKDTQTKTESLYSAKLNGDEGRLELYRSQYKTDDAFKTALKTSLRENDPRISEAVRYWFSGDINARVALIQEIEGEGIFDPEIVRGAINSEINRVNTKASEAAQAERKGDTESYSKIVKGLLETYPKDMIEKLIGKSVGDIQIEETKPNVEKVSSVYRSEDINTALESGDIAFAKDIISELVRVNTENYLAKARAEAEYEGEKFDEKKATEKAETDAKSSVRSSITSYWKPLYKEAHASGNTTEMLRIRDLLFDSGFYGTTRIAVQKTMDGWVEKK